MSLERFPDAQQVKILELLEEKCRGGSHPVDGCDAHLISEELAVPYDDLRPPISDLEERGYVRTGVKTRGSPLGRVLITSHGRDVLHELRAAPQRASEQRRSQIWHYVWDIIKIVVAGIVGFFVGKLT